MSAINIDLIYGNRYYKPKTEQETNPENGSLQPALKSDCPSDSSVRSSQKDGNCALKTEGMQVMAL